MYASVNWVTLGSDTALAPVRLGTLNQNKNTFIEENALQNVVCYLSAIL